MMFDATAQSAGHVVVVSPASQTLFGHTGGVVVTWTIIEFELLPPVPLHVSM
jgi:hypothetical protein